MKKRIKRFLFVWVTTLLGLVSFSALTSYFPSIMEVIAIPIWIATAFTIAKD